MKETTWVLFKFFFFLLCFYFLSNFLSDGEIKGWRPNVWDILGPLCPLSQIWEHFPVLQRLIISVLRSWLMARPSAAPSSWHAVLQKTLTASLATSFQQTCQSHQRCYFLASEIKGVDPGLQLAERKGMGGTLLVGCKTDAFLSRPRGKHVSGITLLTEETFFLLKYSSLKRLEALREFWKLKILRKDKVGRRIFSTKYKRA